MIELVWGKQETLELCHLKVETECLQGSFGIRDETGN